MRRDTPLWLARIGPPVLLAATLAGAFWALRQGQPLGVLGFAEDRAWVLASPDVAVVETLSVRPGDRVQEGDILLTFQTAAVDAEIKVLESQLSLLDAQTGATVAEALAVVDEISVQLAEARAGRARAEAAARAYDGQIASLRSQAEGGLGGGEGIAALEADREAAQGEADSLGGMISALEASLARAQGEATEGAAAPDATRREQDVVRAELEGLRVRRESLTVRSPGTGRVAAVYALPGTTVGAATPLVEVVPETTDRVVACIIEREVAGLLPGTQVEVFPLDGSKMRSGKIAAMGSRWSEPDLRCRTILSRAEYVLPVYLEVTDGAIPSGMRATVRFRSDLAPASVDEDEGTVGEHSP